MRGARTAGSLFSAMLVAGIVAAVPAWAGQASAPVVAPASQASATAALPAPVACNTSAGPCWHPALVSRWQYQLQGSINSSGQCIKGRVRAEYQHQRERDEPEHRSDGDGTAVHPR